jgi:monoamine oxidase
MAEQVVQNWTKEPYILGAYSFPGSARHRKELARSVGGGRLIFAGEHTSAFYSLVPGAALEGRRAAMEAVLTGYIKQNE